MKSSLVTGATGFIGRCLVVALQQRPVGVRVLARDMDKASRLWPDAVTRYYADMTKPETLAGVCESTDTVFHLAGYAHTIGQVLGKLIDSAWYNSAKIRRELGFQPRRNLETALPEMVAEYRGPPRAGAG